MKLAAKPVVLNVKNAKKSMEIALHVNSQLPETFLPVNASPDNMKVEMTV